MKYTIIITVYNKEKYIERAITSAFQQTSTNCKVLVVNDGSTDNSDNIIKKLQKKYKFDYYLKDNTGVADTRNYSIDKVDTKYFLFLDADDILDEKLIETIDKYDDYDVLSFNAIEKNNNLDNIKNINKPIFSGDGKSFFTKMVKEKSEFTVPWGYIYNTNYFKKNKFTYPKGRILEDFYLTPFIIIESKKLISIDYTGYYYVSVDDSITKSKKNTAEITKTYMDFYDMMLEEAKKYDKDTYAYFKSFLSGAMIWYGSTLRDKRQYIKFVKERKMVDDLIRKRYRKQLIKLLYNINLYYPLRKIIKGK